MRRHLIMTVTLLLSHRCNQCAPTPRTQNGDTLDMRRRSARHNRVRVAQHKQNFCSHVCRPTYVRWTHGERRGEKGAGDISFSVNVSICVFCMYVTFYVSRTNNPPTLCANATDITVNALLGALLLYDGALPWSVLRAHAHALACALRVRGCVRRAAAG